MPVPKPVHRLRANVRKILRQLPANDALPTGIMLEQSPSAIEKRLTVTSLASVCFALFAISTFHLPLRLNTAVGPPECIDSIYDYVNSRGPSLGLTFCGRQAQKYVLGAQVFMDLAQCKATLLPTHYASSSAYCWIYYCVGVI